MAKRWAVLSDLKPFLSVCLGMEKSASMPILRIISFAGATRILQVLTVNRDKLALVVGILFIAGYQPPL